MRKLFDFPFTTELNFSARSENHFTKIEGLQQNNICSEKFLTRNETYLLFKLLWWSVISLFLLSSWFEFWRTHKNFKKQRKRRQSMFHLKNDSVKYEIWEIDIAFYLAVIFSKFESNRQLLEESKLLNNRTFCFKHWNSKYEITKQNYESTILRIHKTWHLLLPIERLQSNFSYQMFANSVHVFTDVCSRFWEFFSPICSKIAVECDWNSKISQNVRKLGFLKNLMGFLKKTWIYQNRSWWLIFM